MVDLKPAALQICRSTFAAIDIPATMRRKLARAGSRIIVNDDLLDLAPFLGLGDLRDLNRLLVRCGGSIGEVNAVRKHVSAVKGGRLAVAAGAARKVTLAITDVPEDQESALASGPTLPDPTTVPDVCSVVARYGLLTNLPARIRMQFEHPETIPETPKA